MPAIGEELSQRVTYIWNLNILNSEKMTLLESGVRIGCYYS